MALQIDSFSPTAVNAIVGEQVVMSCEVSGAPVTGTGYLVFSDTSPLNVTNNGTVVSWVGGYPHHETSQKIYLTSFELSLTATLGGNTNSENVINLCDVQIQGSPNNKRLYVYVGSNLVIDRGSFANNSVYDITIAKNQSMYTITIVENGQTILSNHAYTGPDFLQFKLMGWNTNSTMRNVVLTSISKTLIDTSDNSIISTVSPYTYTADLADSGKTFQWEVTDGVTTVQTPAIPVSVISKNTKFARLGDINIYYGS